MHYLTQKSLFYFCSTKDNCVMCVCLQCGGNEQNYHRFLGRNASVHECTFDLRVISVTNVIGHSLLKILMCLSWKLKRSPAVFFSYKAYYNWKSMERRQPDFQLEKETHHLAKAYLYVSHFDTQFSLYFLYKGSFET